MSEFDDLLEEYLGDEEVMSDIRVVIRRLWFYDFDGFPTRMWSGKGRLFTTGGLEWLGTINDNNQDIHVTPRLQDGRDGSSASYQFKMTIPDLPDESSGELYEALKADQGRTFGRELTCYLAIFKDGEGLRPTTPIKFFKRLTMQSPTFSEGFTTGAGGVLVRTYTVSVTAKDGNSGRSKIPNRTYTDTVQREYARQMGVASPPDRGLEYVAQLANKTFTVE
jgi:hypothetical protein